MSLTRAITASAFVATIVAYFALQSWAHDALNLANAPGHVAIILEIIAYLVTAAVARPQTRTGWVAIVISGAVTAGLLIVEICFPASRPLLGVYLWVNLAGLNLYLIPLWFILLIVASFKGERIAFLCTSLFTLVVAALATVPGILITPRELNGRDHR